MSSMLEQAIVDAQALREAALKNAEQALIEKFAPQIKEAVESLLENDVSTGAKTQVAYEGKIYSLLEIEEGKATITRENMKPFVVDESKLGDPSSLLLQEEEGGISGMDSSPSAAIEAPFAGGLGDPEQTVEFSIDVEEPVYILDLEQLKIDSEVSPEMDQEGPSGLSADLGLGGDEEVADEGGGDLLGDLNLQESLNEDEDEDDLIEEIMNLMNEMDDNEEVLEEELIVDVEEKLHGWVTTGKGARTYDEELSKAHMESTQYKEENEGLKKDKEKLKETLTKFKHKNKQYKDVVEKLSQKLNETFLSNAKLLYSNKTLSDASLNERQKNKIVEAIARAKTPEEAKSLCETLSATVNSGGEKRSPRTLSESVQRKSNLSGILPRRKQVNESETHTFADHMKKLAGIK